VRGEEPEDFALNLKHAEASLLKRFCTPLTTSYNVLSLGESTVSVPHPADRRLYQHRRFWCCIHPTPEAVERAARIFNLVQDELGNDSRRQLSATRAVMW